MNKLKIVSLLVIAQLLISCAKDPVEPQDTEKPFVEITQPVKDQQIEINSNITVKANAYDNTGIKNVTFSLPGCDDAVSTMSPYQASWNTTGLAAGKYSVSALATDNSGNQAIHSVSVSIYDPAVGQYWYCDLLVNVLNCVYGRSYRVLIYINNNLARAYNTTTTSNQISVTFDNLALNSVSGNLVRVKVIDDSNSQYIEASATIQTNQTSYTISMSW